MLLAEEGLVTLKEVYTDGTKIESVAGRYTFVWGKSIKNYKENMESTLEQMWEYAQSIANDDEADDPDPDPPSFKKSSPEKIEKTVEKIEKKIKNNPTASIKAKAKLRYIKKNYSTNLKRYQEQEKILGQRSSYRSEERRVGKEWR